MVNGIQKILVLAPHTDDGELGCGASMMRLTQAGCRVYYVAFSICEDSVPAGFDPEVLLQELHDATACLGLQEKDIFVVPSWTRYRHGAHGEAVLFSFNDFPAMKALALWREE